MGHAELGPEDIDESIPPILGAIQRTWKSFCATTSIHGLKYTQDEETNTIMRFIWLLITIVMFICAIAMVITFYIDFRRNPTRMNVENDYAPISSLYFPGLTICPDVFYNLKKAEKYIQTLRLPPHTAIETIVEDLFLGSGFVNDDIRFPRENIDRMEALLQLNNLTLVEFIRHVDWSRDDLFFRCRFQSRIVNCSELFQMSRTYCGHCWSFNINQMGTNFTAKYATHHGIEGGVSVMLHYSNNTSDLWNSYSRGFQLLLHGNSAFPSSHSITKYVALNQQAFLSVSPVETFCSPAVRSLSRDQRHCVFPDEVHLTYCTSYDGGNCELSCRIENMIKNCNCITYAFITQLTKHIRICSYADIPCLWEKFGDMVGRTLKTQCTCPKTCESVEYDTQVTSAALVPGIPTMDEFYDGMQENFSVAHIFLRSQVYRRVKQDLLSNMVTLVSNLGSAFSLFVGMSMVSVVEIMYFFSVVLRKYYLQEVKARQKLLFTRKSKRSPDHSEENHIKFIKIS